MVFTVAENKLEFVGSVQCDNGTGIGIGICGSNTASGFLIVSNDGMLESLTECVILNNTLVATENYMITDSSWYALEPIS